MPGFISTSPSEEREERGPRVTSTSSGRSTPGRGSRRAIQAAAGTDDTSVPWCDVQPTTPRENRSSRTPRTLRPCAGSIHLPPPVVSCVNPLLHRGLLLPMRLPHPCPQYRFSLSDKVNCIKCRYILHRNPCPQNRFSLGDRKTWPRPGQRGRYPRRAVTGALGAEGHGPRWIDNMRVSQ